MAIDLTKYSEIGTLSYAQVDQNWTDIEGADAVNAKTNAANTFQERTTFSKGLVEKKGAMAANDVDLALGAVFEKTISGATTLTVSNVPATGSVGSFILDLTNGGSATITWWAGVKWAGGTEPSWTAAGRDMVGFITHDGGTTWSGIVLGLDIK